MFWKIYFWILLIIPFGFNMCACCDTVYCITALYSPLTLRETVKTGFGAPCLHRDKLRGNDCRAQELILIGISSGLLLILQVSCL